MPVKEADPEARSLEAAFADAMNAPARPREPAAPPVIDPDAPHGRDESGEALAPYGLTKEGKPRKTAAGRPAKDDQPRTAPAQPDGGKDKPAPGTGLAKPGQYAQALSDTADMVWFAASAIGKAAPGIPVIGPMLPAAKIQAQAAIWFATKDRAVAAVSLAAEHNASAARFAAKLGGGDVTWAITCVSLVAPILSLSGMVWAKNADEQLTEAGQPGITELIARNDKMMDQAVAQMTAAAARQAEAAAQAADVGA